MTLSFVYLFIGLLLSNVGHFFTRNRESHHSPVKPDFRFWISDNIVKLAHSVLIAVGLNLLCNLDPKSTTIALRHVPFLPENFEWLAIYSAFLGFFPDAIMAYLKSRFKLLQLKKAIDSNGKTYDRGKI